MQMHRAIMWQTDSFRDTASWWHHHRQWFTKSNLQGEASPITQDRDLLPESERFLDNKLW